MTELPAGWLRHLALGDAHFDDVPVLLYDCAALSAHLGMRIDGVLGFPLFREILLTLDYPGSRIRLQPARNAPLVPGSTVPFDDALKTPVIHIGLGDRSLIALIDSGSDAGLSLNPLGMKPRFSSGPRPGGTVGTIAGDRTQQIGRLADNLTIGGYVMPEPIVELTDELSAIGGGVLSFLIGRSGPALAFKTAALAIPVVGPLVRYGTGPALMAGYTWVLGEAFRRHFAAGGSTQDFTVKRFREIARDLVPRSALG